ncbi:MAG: molecular chaperone HtpG, partial [Clostridia bacterium]|nr:molecular chaperone HtpG [Clostridia bacterium]
KEIFLRELISNASDAIDKLYYKSLTDNLGLNRDDFAITVDYDPKARTLSVTDNGIGMDEAELDSNLGVIARSGSEEFKRLNPDDNVDIIGQFGVGFYSGFMVAQKIEVTTRKYGEEEAHLWRSIGAEGYEIKPCERETNGTTVKLFLKDNTEEERYDDYCEEYTLRDLIKRYSDYIRYPIKMKVTEYRYGEDVKEEERTYQEVKTINSMVPLWVKAKKDVTQEEYDSFYRTTFHDGEAPLLTIHTSVEGKVDYKALLFVPAKAPYDYYSKEYEKGLKLYTAGVMISERLADLLPDCFSFVKGLVDSDLPLNISRETIQHNYQLKAIAENIKTKIQKELLALLKNDRAKYETFYKAFGLQLKYGVYADWGLNKEFLQDLILFESVKEGKQITFSEYVAAMPEGQTEIYYGVGKSALAVKSMPQSEALLAKGYDILVLSQDIDEFALRSMQSYQDKPFKSIAQETLQEEGESAHQDVLDALKEVLGDKVGKVVSSAALGSHAVCLTASGEVSLEMERVLNAMPNAMGGVKAERVLSVNVDHPVFAKLCAYLGTDKPLFDTLAEVLYDQAVLAAGLEPDDPQGYVDKVTKLLSV